VLFAAAAPVTAGTAGGVPMTSVLSALMRLSNSRMVPREGRPHSGCPTQANQK
jgi:hypothetical protein